MVNLNCCLKSFERLGVHLVLLISDGQLVPREDVLGAKLLFDRAVCAGLFFNCIFEDLRANIYLVGCLVYHFVNAYALQRPLRVAYEATGRRQIFARDRSQKRILSLMCCDGSVVGVRC